MRIQNSWNAQFAIHLFILPSKTPAMLQAMNQLIHPPKHPQSATIALTYTFISTDIHPHNHQSVTHPAHKSQSFYSSN